MNDKDIQYLIDHGLENDRVKLSVIRSIYNVEPLQKIALSEPKLLMYSPSDISTVPLFEAYFLKAIQGLSQRDIVPFIIFDKSVKQYAGTSRFGNISPINQRLEIGWTWLGKDFQRTGLNRNNKLLMLSYAFETLNYERVELKADGANRQSRIAMEGIGAQYEGALRSHTLMSDGRRRDTVYYSILKSEWPDVKKNLIRKINEY